MANDQPRGASDALDRTNIRTNARGRGVVAVLLGMMLSSRSGATESRPVPDRTLPPPRKLAFETVVVAPAAPFAEPRDDQAAAASVVTRERTPRSSESAVEILSELPGVSVTRFGGLGALATMSLRGSTADQVAVYIDGIPLNSAVAGAVDLGLIPIGDMERLEVYRGMSPIRFGASALGGIVSLSSREPDRNVAGAEVGGGSFGTGFAAFDAGAAGRRAGVGLNLNLLQSEGDFTFRTDNGTAFVASDDADVRRRNNALSQGDGSARGRVVLGEGRSLTGSAWLFARDQGLPGHGLFQSHFASLSTRRLMLALRYDGRADLGPGGPLRVQLWGVGAEQRLDDERGEVGLGAAKTRDRTVTAGLTVDARRVIGDHTRLNGLFEGRHETFDPHDALGDTVTAPGSTRLFSAQGVEASTWWRALDLEVQPSLRLELARDHVAEPSSFANQPGVARDENHVEPVYRLALIRHAGETLAFKANGGRYARLPTIRERYGNTGLFLGNADLAPETGFNVDAGLVWTTAGRWGAIRLDAAAFAAWVDRLIQLEQGAYYVRAVNIDRAFVRGVESSVVARAGRHVHLFAQATFTDARDTSDIAARKDKQLPLRPQVRGYARPELRDLAVPGFGRLRAGVYADVDHTAGNFHDPANLVRFPARTVIGAGFHLTWVRALRLTVSARNLGGSRILDYSGYPLPGRSLFFTLRFMADFDDQGDS
jgi:iron complex outermembrane receptor protein